MDNRDFGYDELKTNWNKKDDFANAEPTPAELSEYSEKRAEAPDIALQTIREDTYKNRVNSNLKAVSLGKIELDSNIKQNQYQPSDYNSLLKSTEDRKYREEQSTLNQALDAEKKQIQSQIDNRHHEFMQNINKSFEYYLEQHPRVYERPETPKDVETKSVSKEIAKRIAAFGLAVFVVAGAAHIGSNIQKSDAKLKDEQDALNAMQAQKMETEQQIEDLREKARENEKDYMAYYDENGNMIVYDQNSREDRKKVVSIENKENNYVESATKGGRQ